MIRLPRRRAGLALVTAGVTCFGSAAAGGVAMTATAHADSAAPGSGFGALDLTAISASIRLPMYSHSAEDASISVPFAQSELKAGGVSHAVTSVFWPGATGANGGKVLGLLGAQCVPPNPQGLLPVPCVTTAPEPPDQVYQALNDPEKAETTNSGKDTVTLDRPYGTMTATATETKALADTTMAGGKTTPVPSTFGATSASTSEVLTGPKMAVVDAVSTVRKLDIGGVITIGSVTSLAHATTDGVKATGTAHTTISDMKIGGVPVTVDEHGITVQGHNASTAQATAAVNQALAQSGFKLFLTQPRKDVNGNKATLDSGGLIITQSNSGYTGNANDTGQMIVIGGASIIAGASPGFPYVPVPLPGVASVPGGGGAAPAAPAMPAAGGSAPIDAAPGGAPVVAGSGDGQAAPVLASNKLPLPTGTSAVLVILALLGAGLVAAGLRRFTDQVLVAGGPACPLGEQ